MTTTGFLAEAAVPAVQVAMNMPSASRDARLSCQWDQTLSDLDSLVQQHGSDQNAVSYVGITKHHWRPNNHRPCCAARDCRKKFSLTERHHHCRRCGDLFCKACTRYKRRLNSLAHPDPSGRLRKVCKACFDQGPQTLGQTRSCFAVFAQFKSSQLYLNTNSSNGMTHRVRRKKFNIKDECRRLTDGFQKNLTRSGLKWALHEMTGMMKVPEWQKSKFWTTEDLVTNCRGCFKAFGLLNARTHCRVCGAAVCSSCSSKNLIVYLLNSEKNTDSAEPKLSIIKIVGCPEKEPDVCLYLRVCEPCHLELQDIQIMEYQEVLDSQSPHQDIWQDILRVNGNLCDTQAKIESLLPKYQELIESLEIGPGASASLPQAKSNIQILAKAQGDLSDHLTQLVMTILSLKKSKPSTRGQSTVLRNLIKAKTEYYQENMFLFRELKRKLEAVTPAEVLECIQQIVERNAINSCYMFLKQLAFEVLHLCTKYKVQDDFAVHLVQTEEIVLEELQKCLIQGGEDWEDHERCVNQLLQIQLKEHRLIRPSTRLVQKQGSNHIKMLIKERCDTVLQQICLQVKAKSADKHFQSTKEALDALLDKLQAIDWQTSAKNNSKK